MGQEINVTTFSEQDSEDFLKKLRVETNELKKWFDQKLFDTKNLKCGLELEAWLVDKDFRPSPSSDTFVKELHNSLVVPEISKYNFELNSHPYSFNEDTFSRMESDTLRLWQKCTKKAQELDLMAFTIGTLPTLRDYMLTLDQLSPQKRYFALNHRILEMRKGQSTILDFEGKDHIHIEHDDVITECAATSMQIHFGVTQESGPRYYNSSVIASSFVAAVAANSPYFYGKELWDESRIPIFEQSINLKSFRRKDGSIANRVNLGNGYVRDSLFEIFLENLSGYPPLLPLVQDSNPEWLNHLRLHSGTIWRWNRPIIGLNKSGKPGLRLEFRVPSAGPTIRDSIANMVFQIALVQFLYKIDEIEKKLPFEKAEENFYLAARYGLKADVNWIDGKRYNIQALLMNEILPNLPNALRQLRVGDKDIEKYLTKTICERIRKGQNGAEWQKSFVHFNGTRFQEMLEHYHKFQKENLPVHLWTL